MLFNYRVAIAKQKQFSKGMIHSLVGCVCLNKSITSLFFSYLLKYILILGSV